MHNLSKNQTNEINRVDKLLNFLNIIAFKSLWFLYIPFKSQVNALTTNLASVYDKAGTKELTGKGLTDQKSQLKADFSEAMGVLLSKTTAYAIVENLPDLKEKVNYSESEIFHFKDADIFAFASSLKINVFIPDLFTNDDFIPYEVTEQNFDDAYTLAAEFNDLIGAAPTVETTSNVANKEINDVILEMRKNIEVLTYLIPHFKNINLDLCKGFYPASRRSDIGVHHTGLHASVTLNGTAVKGATVTIGKKTSISDLEGFCNPIIVRSGLKEITCELTGHPKKTINHRFINGHMDDMTFEF